MHERFAKTKAKHFSTYLCLISGEVMIFFQSLKDKTTQKIFMQRLTSKKAK